MTQLAATGTEHLEKITEKNILLVHGYAGLDSWSAMVRYRLKIMEGKDSSKAVHLTAVRKQREGEKGEGWVGREEGGYSV